MAVIKIVPMPGAVGDKGDEGAPGPQGPQGPAGQNGLPGTPALWSYQGAWQSNAAYATGDIVTYQGQLYYTKSVTTAGTLPTNATKFDLIAAKGVDGEPGLNGLEGDQGPQGEPGADGSPGLVYLGDYISGNGYIANIAVVKGADENLYIAKASGGLLSPVANPGQWDLFLPKGANGADGATPFTLIGAYDNGASYNLGIAVYYNGGTYVRTGNPLNPGYPPTFGAVNESWTPIAEKGEPGTPADLESAFSEVLYTVGGGTNGTQPTFDGAPLFTGSYTKTGNLVHFRVNVGMTNITNFGSGQYYVTVPFTSEHDVYVRNGQLKHSSGDMYSISGHAVAGSDQLKLYTTASNGKEVAFTSSVPVGLNSSCDFHIFGSYFSTPNP